MSQSTAQPGFAQAYRDNRAVLQYELARRLEVGTALAGKAPQPVVIRTDSDSGGGDASALTTLLAAQLLPRLAPPPSPPGGGA